MVSQVVSEPVEKLCIRRTHSDLKLYLPYKMSGEEPAHLIAPVESHQMVSNIKLPILKKGEYTLWSMRMEQYLTNTDYELWQVIMNGVEPIQTTTDENGVETEVPPVLKLKFHTIKDAKSLWAAIKSRFGGNVESKKMQKTVLKQQFKNFSVSDIEGLDKASNRFKNIAAYKKLMGIDELDIDDLYNNLNIFEADIKARHSSSGQASSSLYTDDLMFSFFDSQLNSPQLDDKCNTSKNVCRSEILSGGVTS
nr:hypothetical protein [Tanacetum cinerariifolium]